MNEERSFERFVADNVAGTSQGTPLPDDFYDDMHSFASSTGQRPEWLALIKEPPMRTDNHLAVGSPAVRVAAILAATLLLVVAMAAAGAGAQRLLAAEDDATDVDADIVVAQDGSGDYETITEAITAAADGDSVLIKAGTYVESLTIDKDIELRGEDHDLVVVESEWGAQPYADTFWDEPVGTSVIVEARDAVIGDLTLRSQAPATRVVMDSEGFIRPINNWSVVVNGGMPRIEGIRVEQGTGPVYIHGISSVTMSGSDLADQWIFVVEGSPATIESSSFEAVSATVGWDLEGDRYSAVEIRDNTTSGIEINGGAAVVGNTIVPPQRSEDEIADGATESVGHGIDVTGGFDWQIRQNTLTGFTDATAIDIRGNSAGFVFQNALDGSGIGIAVENGEHVLEENVVTGGGVGMTLMAGRQDVLGNEITGAEDVGLEIAGGAILRDNRVCDNAEDLRLVGDGGVDLDESNEICDGGAQ